MVGLSVFNCRVSLIYSFKLDKKVLDESRQQAKPNMGPRSTRPTCYVHSPIPLKARRKIMSSLMPVVPSLLL